MSTPLHVLLKANPNLEGDVEYDKSDHSACYPLDQVSVLQYFGGTASCMERQTGWTFSESSCHSSYTVLANRAGWRVAGDLVPRESPDNS